MTARKSNPKLHGPAVVSPGTVLVSRHGYMRVSADLIPEAMRGKRLTFTATMEPDTKRLFLRPILRVEDGRHTGMGIRVKAWYSAPGGVSPFLSIGSVFRCLGLKLPDESVSYPATAGEDGVIEVSF